MLPPFGIHQNYISDGVNPARGMYQQSYLWQFIFLLFHFILLTKSSPILDSPHQILTNPWCSSSNPHQSLMLFTKSSPIPDALQQIPTNPRFFSPNPHQILTNPWFSSPNSHLSLILPTKSSNVCLPSLLTNFSTFFFSKFLPLSIHLHYLLCLGNVFCSVFNLSYSQKVWSGQ